MIEVEELWFSYHRRLPPVLEDLSFTFAPGAVTAVTGPSGCGKSTLLYLLGLLLTPSRGRVLYDGTDVSRLPDRERSRIRAARMGFVFQDASLDSTRTVEDNVLEGGLYAGMERRPTQHRAAALLEQFGVSLRTGHRPGEVSGGQAQRVALCRGLLKEPEVLLADEPTGNLDPASSEVVWSALADAAAAGATVIVASHHPDLVARSHHVLAL